MAYLSVEDLHVAYGPVQALRGVNLEVAEGAIVAIIGANGAGKTTLLNTLSGIVKPRQWLTRGGARPGDRSRRHSGRSGRARSGTSRRPRRPPPPR